MRRKRANRADWWRITRKRFYVTRIDTNEYSGYITLLCMDEVREPLFVAFQDRRVCIADAGYSWLQHFPKNACYTLTTMFDASNEVVQWYIDICKRHGIDEQGMIWYEDLYLDIAIMPSGELALLDVDELDKALQQQQVTQIDYDFAWREADSLITAIEEDLFPLLSFSETHLDSVIKLSS